MNSVIRRWLLRYAGIAGVLLCALAPSCNSNFIPVPPPGEPSFEPVQVVDALGTPRQVWQVRGASNESMKSARVAVFNLSLGLGVLVNASNTGSYVSGIFEGALGDKVEISYETPSADKSPVICRKLQPGQAAAACD